MIEEDGGRLQEQKDGPLTTFCWGEDYLVEEEASEPWQAELEGPDGVVILCGNGRTREEAIADLKANAPARIRDLRETALSQLQKLGEKARFLEEFLNPHPQQKPAFGVRGTFLHIPPDTGHGANDVPGYAHVFRVKGAKKGERDYRFCMEDLEVVIATDYAVLYDVDGRKRLDFPEPTGRAAAIIKQLKEKDHDSLGSGEDRGPDGG